MAADLSSVGGSSSTSLTRASDGFTYSLDVSISASQAVGSYSIPVTMTPSAGAATTKASVIRVVTAIPAVVFTNSDMEENVSSSALLPSGSVYETTTGHDGSTTRAMHLKNTVQVGSNGYAFTSASTCNAKGSNSKITFWLKGSSTNSGAGTSGSLSINYGGKYFNLASTTGATPIVSATSNSYTGTLSFAVWTKITLDVSSIDDSTITPAAFSLKFGKSGLYDLYIDDICYEP
jgi:hypothetical protein